LERQHAIDHLGYQYQSRKPSEKKKKRMTKTKLAKLTAQLRAADRPAQLAPTAKCRLHRSTHSTKVGGHTEVSWRGPADVAVGELFFSYGGKYMDPETLPLPKHVRHHVRQWADSTSVFKQELYFNGGGR